MNWDYWRTEFSKYLPPDYVDKEIERYQKSLSNREVWPDLFAAMQLYTKVLEATLDNLRRQTKQDQD